MAYITLTYIIFSSLFWPEKYSGNDFAFHSTDDMSQFVEKSEETIGKSIGNLASGVRMRLPQRNYLGKKRCMVSATGIIHIF